MTERAGQAARDVARAVLRRVEQGEAYATLALGGALAKSKLSPADRGLATEIVYGVLRHRTRLDRALAMHAPRGLGTLPAPVLIALRAAAYQILLLRVPAHAAVDDAVDAIKTNVGPKVANFANAVLRKVATVGEPPPPKDLTARLVEMDSLPEWIARRLVASVGEADADAAAEAMNRPPPVTLRAAPRVGATGLAARILEERPGTKVEPAGFPPEALFVRGGGALEQLGVFQDGSCTVQDLAAQLVGRLAGDAIQPGEKILDACAGVGGKSTHLAELAAGAAGKEGRSLLPDLDAADNSQRKLDMAVDSARRLGLPPLKPIVCDLTRPDAPLAAAYDRVILDAPCSGLGVLRRHPEGKWRRAEAEIAGLATLQRQLLDALAPRVKPGGLLVYSVCTFTDEEGRGQIARFLTDHPDFATEKPTDPGFLPFLDESGAIRTWPHRHDADAFYAVRLRRAHRL